MSGLEWEFTAPLPLGFDFSVQNIPIVPEAIDEIFSLGDGHLVATREVLDLVILATGYSRAVGCASVRLVVRHEASPERDT